MRAHTLPLLMVMALVACGPTVGDPCTTATECGGQTCLQRDFSPGGYCSMPCNQSEFSCPAGTTCVREASGRNAAGCMKSCRDGNDCRDGYVCRQEKDSATSICVGPSGI